MKNLYYFFAISLFFFSSCDKPCIETNPNIYSIGGCGDFIVFKNFSINTDCSYYLVIYVDRDSVDLYDSFKEFSILNNPFISSNIEHYNKQTPHYCNDYALADVVLLNTFELTEGKVDIRIARDRTEVDDNYLIDLILFDALYLDQNQEEIRLDKIEFDNVLVGWSPG